MFWGFCLSFFIRHLSCRAFVPRGQKTPYPFRVIDTRCRDEWSGERECFLICILAGEKRGRGKESLCHRCEAMLVEGLSIGFPQTPPCLCHFLFLSLSLVSQRVISRLSFCCFFSSWVLTHFYPLCACRGA